ncbi:hypothetical protein ACEWY4_023915 [Coilia grayii]|uniref:[histone H3]-lysine(4) N-trimethyltransferase n=1 Tax=Coilia grayii TaxID=363190 RepID=A0ABD1IYU6_9TELE
MEEMEGDLEAFGRWLDSKMLKNSDLRKRQEAILELEKRIQQKEKADNCYHFLYNSAHKSLLECESVMKGFYNMLDLEYRDSDSEDGDSGNKQKANVIQIEDADMEDDEDCEDNHLENMDIDDPNTNLPGVKADQDEMMESTSKALKESSQSQSTRSQLRKQTVNAVDRTPAPTLGADTDIRTSMIAAASTPSTPEALPSCESPSLPLPTTSTGPTGRRRPPSELLKSTDATLIKSKLKSYLSRSDSPQPPTRNSASCGTSKTGKVSTPRSTSKEMASTPVCALANVTPKDSNKTTSNTKSKKEKSIKSYMNETHKPTISNGTAKPSKHSGSINSETIPPKKKHRPDSSETLTSNSAMSSVSNSKSGSKTVVNSKAVMTDCTLSTSQSSSSAKKSSKTPIETPSTSKTQTSLPTTTTTTAAGNPCATKETVSKTGAPYKQLTVSEVWGVEPNNTASDKSKPVQPVKEQSGGMTKASDKNKPVQPVKELSVGMKVLGRRRTKTWQEGVLTEIRPTGEGGSFKYKVYFEEKGKILLSGHHIAFTGPPTLNQLEVGSRVAARFHEGTQSWILSATLAELPDRKNRMRFLMFYDDGNVGYVTLPDMHLVYKPLENLGEDIEDEEVKKFVQATLKPGYTPTILVLQEGEELQVEHNGKWKEARITSVDSSLVKVDFKSDDHSEWLYKGSERLHYVYRMKQRALEAKGKERTAHADSSRVPPKPQTALTALLSSKTPTSTPTTSTTTSDNTTSTKKSISSPQNGPPALSKAAVPRTTESVQEVTSAKMQPHIVLQRMPITKIMQFISLYSVQALPDTAASSPPPRAIKSPLSSPEKNSHITSFSRTMYNPHRCCPACLDAHRPSRPNPYSGSNPLQLPQLHGFHRITGRYRIDHKVLFHVFYRSPCGRSLSTMGHVQDFLFSTRCDFLSLDMFSLDPYVLVKRAVPPGQPQTFFSVPDISNGVESVPIPCINQVDNTRPQFANYISQRRPVQGVNINTQTSFLVGCDCTDGCLDRTKCSCHQLTTEATSLCPGGPVDESAGYAHKRLPKALATGLYECNPLCRCDPRMCCNRVVQHGPQLRLQMFMTQHKGWGIRCLDDVSKGTFVCTFAGNVMTDEMANAEGKVSGDEYFANLDFIEGVEKMKEGYESSAYCSDSDDKQNRNPQPTAAYKSSGDAPMSISIDDDGESDDNDDSSDDDFEALSDEHVSSDDSDVAYDVDEDITVQRDYITRRNAKILKVAVGEKSQGRTRPYFAVKSTHRKVKPSSETTKAENKKDLLTRNCTRKLFDGEESCYIIDARHHGNVGRYINHSCDPNLFVQNVFVDTHDLRFPWVAFFTSKRVRAGTELTWDYNYEVGSVEGKLLLCCCGSERCTGRLL